MANGCGVVVVVVQSKWFMVMGLDGRQSIWMDRLIHPSSVSFSRRPGFAASGAEYLLLRQGLQ
jgi:hypothetical protein